MAGAFDWVNKEIDKAKDQYERAKENFASSPLNPFPQVKRDKEAAQEEYVADQVEIDKADVYQLRDLLNRQMGDYEKKSGENLAKQKGLISGDINTGLNESRRDITKDFNRRGLLGSGLQLKAKAGAEAGAASDYAQRTADLSDKYQDQVGKMRDTVANVGLGAAGLEQDQAQEYYREAVKNMMAQNQAYSDIGTGIGRGVGAYYGSKDKKGA